MDKNQRLNLMRKVLRDNNTKRSPVANKDSNLRTNGERQIAGMCRYLGQVFLYPEKQLPPEGLGIDVLMSLNGAV